MKKLAAGLMAASAMLSCASYGQESSTAPKQRVEVNQFVWAQFTKDEQISILEKFPGIEITPVEAVGKVESVQVADRSTPGTNGGAALGSAIGQATYLDKALKGNNNYSAKSHLGAGLLGAMVGSSLDSRASKRFVFSYAIRTADGQLMEARAESIEEFTRPIGQCVFTQSLQPAPSALCINEKAQFIKQLSGIAKASDDGPQNISPLTKVKCRIPGVGLMTLDNSSCIQMDGKVE